MTPRGYFPLARGKYPLSSFLPPSNSNPEDTMNEDWKTIDPAPPKYALHADPNKPLRDAHTVIRQLNDRLAELNEQVSQLKNLHEEDEAQIKLLRSMMNNMRETSLLEKRRLNAQVDTVITERNVYRSIINRLLNLKD